MTAKTDLTAQIATLRKRLVGPQSPEQAKQVLRWFVRPFIKRTAVYP